MSNEYQESVLAAYKKLKEESRLASRLVEPTTGNLRREALRIFSDRSSEADLRILSSFLKMSEHNKEYVSLINSIDADSFRPLVNFMVGNSSTTSITNVDLLAWLIDFKPRPSTEFFRSPRDKSGQTRGGTVITGKKPTLLKTKILILTVGMLLLLAWSGAFLWWRNGYIINSIINPENAKCMHWVGNRYESIDCNEKSGRSDIIPLDPVKLSRFRRIMLRDTLTKNSLGKVWCANVGKDAVFFTDNGINPIDSTKRLRPMTTYMLAKYASYPRYLLQLFIWVISGVSLGILFSLWAFLLLKKKKGPATS